VKVKSQWNSIGRTGIIHLFTMPDALHPVQTATAQDIKSGQEPAAERCAHLTVFDGIPLPTKAGGKIYGLPMKPSTLHPATTAPGVSDACAHAGPTGDGGMAPMIISITTAQAAQTGLPCAY